MDALFGTELSQPVKFIGAFIAVLAIIALAAFLVRRFGVGALTGGTQRNRQQRLAVVDSADVDIRRKLIIVRRDNVEHLLLIGGPTDVLVESNIVRAAATQTARDIPVRETPARAAVVEPPTPLTADGSWPHAVPATPTHADMPVRPAPAPRPEPMFRVEHPAHPEPFILPELRREPTVVRTSQPAQTGNDAPHPTIPSWMPTEVVPARPAAEAVRASAEPPVPTPTPAPASGVSAPRDLDVVPEVKAEAPAAPPPAPQPAARTAQISLRGIVAKTDKPEPMTSSEEQNLADMAQRLEAALRRPLAAGAPRQPSPTVTVAPRGAPQPARPAANTASPAPRSDPPTYENLQREMANLLGRQSGSS